MPILLWHLPLVIFFGSWDAAVSPSEKRSVEATLDARLAPETPELPPFRSEAPARATRRLLEDGGDATGARRGWKARPPPSSTSCAGVVSTFRSSF